MQTLYVTAPTEAAGSLARDLVEERLAACVNRLDCASTYRWEGEIHEDDEELLFVKTTDEAAERCREWLETNHPYDVPCIETFTPEAVLPAFAAWTDDVVEPAGASE